MQETNTFVPYLTTLDEFRTSPHIDHRETGQRAARVLVRQLRGEIRPVMRMVKVPMVTPASTHRHDTDGPFKRVQGAKRTQVELANIRAGPPRGVLGPWSIPPLYPSIPLPIFAARCSSCTKC
jgi:microcystin degradation protein MlrC